MEYSRRRPPGKDIAMDENITNSIADEQSEPIPGKVIKAAVLSLIFLAALLGNLLLWIVVISKKRLRSSSNALLLSLSGADILVAVINMPFTVTNIIAGEWLFSSNLCTALGFVNMVTFVCSVMSLGAVSLNRYVYIVHNSRYRAVYSRRNTGIMITGIWIFSSLLSIPPLLGWAFYDFLPGQSICFCNWKRSVSYTIFMVVTCFGGPCSLMTFSYVNILREYKRIKIQVESHNANSRERTETMNSNAPRGEARISVIRTEFINIPANSQSRFMRRNGGKAEQKKRDDLKLVKTFLVVIFLFVGCWFPFCITMFWNVFSEIPIPRSIDFTSLLLGYFNSCCNPIVYGIMNKQFRNGYLNVLRCRRSGKGALLAGTVNTVNKVGSVNTLDVNRSTLTSYVSRSERNRIFH